MRKRMATMTMFVFLATAISGFAADHSYYLPYFTAAENHWSGMGLRNSASEVANVSVMLYAQNGTLLSEESRGISPRGQDAFVIGDGLDQEEEGWVRINSDQPLTGLNFFGTLGPGNHMADIGLTSDLSTTLHIPHIGQDDLWDSTVMICNPNDGETSLTLTFVDKEGNPLFSQTHVLPANGGGKYEVSSLLRGNAYGNGSIEISADNGIAAFALFANLKSGGKCFGGIGAIPPFSSNHSIVQKDGIEYALQTDKSVYHSGEEVKIRYRVTNRSDSPKNLGTVPDCEYCRQEFFVTQEEREIWRSCPTIPPCGFTEFELNPGESRMYEGKWDMTNDNGTSEDRDDDFPVPAGGYNITGEPRLTEGERVRNSVCIEIKP